MRLKLSMIRVILLLTIVPAMAVIGTSQDNSRSDEQPLSAPAATSEGDSRLNSSKDDPVPPKRGDDLSEGEPPDEAQKDRQSGKSKLELQQERLLELLKSTRAKHDELLQGSNVQNELVRIRDAKLEALQKELARIQREMKNDHAARLESIRAGELTMDAIQEKVSEAQNKLKSASVTAKEAKKIAEQATVDAIQKELSHVMRMWGDANRRKNDSSDSETPTTAEPKFDELAAGSVVTDSAISISQLLRKHLEDKLEIWEQDYRDAEKAVTRATASYQKDVANDLPTIDIKTTRSRLQTLVDRSFHAQLLVQECRMQLASIDLQLLQARQQHRKTLAEKIILRRVEELTRRENISEPTSAHQKRKPPEQGTPVELIPEIFLSDPIAGQRDTAEASAREPVFFTTSPSIAFKDVLDGKPAAELTPHSHLRSRTYAPEAENGPQAEKRRAWTEAYVDEVNKYLSESLETESATENWRRVAGSLDKLIPKWNPSDKANLRRTGELLFEFANRNAASLDENRCGLVHSAMYLRQVARMTGVIPNAIKRSSPTGERTTEKMKLLSTMLEHQADLVWINQEQVRLAGLIDDAPYQVVRLLIEKKARDLGPWFYALSNVDKDQTSLKFHDVPPIDPVLFVTILRSLTGVVEENDHNLCQLFNQKNPSQIFSRDIHEIMRGETVQRTTVLRSFAGILQGTKSEALKLKIARLVPGVIVFLQEQQMDTNVLRDRSGEAVRMSNAKAIPRGEDSIFEALTSCQIVAASGSLRNHNFSINYRISLSRLAHELESIAHQKRDLSIYVTSENEKARALMLFVHDADSAPELAIQILNAIEVSTERQTSSSAELVVPNPNLERIHGYKFVDSADALRSDDYDSITIGQWKGDGQISFALPSDCDRGRIVTAVENLRNEGIRILLMKSASEKRVQLCVTESDAGTLTRAIVRGAILHDSER